MADDSSRWEDVCWICLQSSIEVSQDTPLVYPCACPRPVHQKCLAKWQLHQAGRDEESRCRFCQQLLPQWRQAFKPTSSSSQVVVQCQPLMSIQYHGQTYWLHVQTGQGGVEAFKADVKRLLGLSPQDDFDITFECQVPGEGGKVELHGLEAFDAAVYCATFTAAERLAADTADTSSPDGSPTNSITNTGPHSSSSSSSSSSTPLEQSASASGHGVNVGAGAGLEHVTDDADLIQLYPTVGRSTPPSASTPPSSQAPGSSSSSGRGQNQGNYRKDGSNGGSSNGGSSGSMQRVASMASSYDTASEGDGLSCYWLQGEHTCHFVSTCPSSTQPDENSGGGSSSGSPGVLAAVRRAWHWATDKLNME